MAKLTGKAKAAFLRRMKRGRNKVKRARKRSRGHTHESHHKGRKRSMAKRRKSSFRTRARRAGRRAARGVSKFIPNNQELLQLGTAYGYGKLEGAADKDAKHILNSVPTFVPQAGRSGNIGIAAWVASKFIKRPAAHAIALGILSVAAYQHGRGSGFQAGKQNFTMAAGGSRRRDEQMVENYLQGL